MRYQLPAAAKTSKLLNLPADLLALAEEALAEKFDLPEIVKEKPKPKPKADKPKIGMKKQSDAYDQIPFYRIDIELMTPYSTERRSMAVEVFGGEREFHHNLGREVSRMYDEARYKYGWGGGREMGHRMMVRFYAVGRHWEWRDGDDFVRLTQLIWRAFSEDRRKQEYDAPANWQAIRF